MNLKYTSFL